MKNKIKIIISIILISILIIVGIEIGNQGKVELTQLSPQTKNQMMGYILKTKQNKVIIVDGGTDADAGNLENYINKYGGKVDYWFLTHAHNDHAGAFHNIINNTDIEISNIYISLNDKQWYEINEPTRIYFTKSLIDTLNSEKIKDKVKSPTLNEIIQIDGIKVEILGIKNPEIVNNAGNEQSMIIRFDTGKTSVLILGDAGEGNSEKLLQTQKEKLKSDMVQMAHHGQDGATEELYKIINPSKCLWPTTTWLWNNDAGTGENTGKWKTFETRNWMEKLKVEKNYNAKDGNIVITLE